MAPTYDVPGLFGFLLNSDPHSAALPNPTPVRNPRQLQRQAESAFQSSAALLVAIGRKWWKKDSRAKNSQEIEKT